MLRFIKKHDGSITIFLLAIMLPMLVFSFSIVDLCKIFMAKDAAEQATDLALNAGLTSYDTVLKDMYGLLATSSSAEELTEKMTEYYIATLESSGISVDNRPDIENGISGLLNTDIPESLANNNSFLKVFSVSDEKGNTLTASPEAVSAISNPTVMHRQIVEYMKYRGPVYLTNGMLEKINAFKDLNHQTDATNAKIEFEESLSDINNNAVKAYAYFCLFFANNEQMQNEREDVFPHGIPYPDENIQKAAIEEHQYISRDFPLNSLYNSEIGDYIPKSIREDLDKAAANGIVYGYYANCFNGTDSKLKRNDNVNKAIEVIDQASNTGNAKTLSKKLDEDVEEVVNYQKNHLNGSGIEDILSRDHVIEALEELDKFTQEPSSALDAELIRDGVMILKLYSNLFEKANNSDGKFASACIQLCKDYVAANKLINYYIKDKDHDHFDDAQSLMSAIDECNTAVMNDLIENIKVIEEYVNIWHETGSKAFENAAKKLNYMMDGVLKQFNILDELTSKKLLDDIYDDFVKAKEKAATYKENVGKIETESVKTSFEAQYVNEAKDIEALNKADVDELKDTLSKYKEIYRDYKNVLTGLRFFGKPIVDSPNKTNNKELKGDERLKFKSLDEVLKAFIKSNVDWQHIGNVYLDNVLNSPDKFTMPSGLNAWTDYNSKAITDNSIYKKIKQICVVEHDNDNKTDKSMKNKVQENSKETSSDDIIKSRTNEDSSDDSSDEDSEEDTDKSDEFKPSDYTLFSEYIKQIQSDYTVLGENEVNTGSSANAQGNDKTVKKNATNALSGVASFIENVALAARDDLYITEYLTNNFSCHTTTKNADEKMLSGVLFSVDGSENVVWYGSELEYILYGKNTEDANKIASGAAIFAVRFALNLIYSYTDAEITQFTLAVATAAGGWLPFSIPLIQAVLHIGLSVAESSYDLMTLLDGGSVPIFKTQSTWVCKGSNIVRKVATDVTINVTKYGLNKGATKVCNFIEENSNKLTNTAVTSITGFEQMVSEEIDSIREQVENDIVSPIETVFQNYMTMYGTALSSSQNLKDELKASLQETISNAKNSLGITSGKDYSNDVIRQAEVKVFAYLERPGTIDTLTGIMVNNIKEFMDKAVGVRASDYTEPQTNVSLDAGRNINPPKGSFHSLFRQKFKGLFDNIQSAVSGVSDQVKTCVKEAISDASKELQKGVKKTAKEIGESIENKLNKSLRGHQDYDINYGGKASNSAMLSMTYKDYMYVFTLIGLTFNESSMLQRAALLMQANCVKNGAPSDYNINHACTLIKAESRAAVRTVVWGAVMEDGELNLSGVSGKYKFTNISYAGY